MAHDLHDGGFIQTRTAHIGSGCPPQVVNPEARLTGLLQGGAPGFFEVTDGLAIVMKDVGAIEATKGMGSLNNFKRRSVKCHYPSGSILGILGSQPHLTGIKAHVAPFEAAKLTLAPAKVTGKLNRQPQIVW